MALKRMMSVVLITLMTMVFIVGCSSNNGNTNTGSENVSTGNEVADNNESTETVTLEFFTWLSEGTAKWEQILPKFYEQYPNIKVNVNILANNDDSHEALKKMDLAAASGQPMDIVMINDATGYAQRVNAGMLAPLDEFIEAEDIDYDAVYKASTKINEHYYALPGRLLTWFVMLNKDELDAAGLEVPTEWTWDEFIDYAKQLTNGEGPSKMYGTYLHTWIQYMTLAHINDPNNNTLLSLDYTEPNIDNDRIRKSLEIANQLQNVDKSAQSYANVISQKLAYRSEYFGEKAAMIPTGNWMITEAAGTETFPATFTTVFAPLPKYQESDENGLTVASVDYIGVAAKSEHPQEAYYFLRWLTTEGLMLGNMIPAWNDVDLNVLIEGILEGTPNPEFVDTESLKYVMEVSKPVDIITPPTFGSEVQSRYIAEVEKYLLEQQDLETTIANATNSIQEIIDANK